MKQKNYKKNISLFLLLAVVMQLLPLKKSEAFPVEEVGPLLGVAGAIAGNTAATAGAAATTAGATTISAAANTSSAAALGIVGSGTAAAAAFIAQKKACEAATGNILELFDEGNKLGGFSLLGVNPTEAVTIQARIVRLQVLKKCYETVLDAAKAVNVTLIDIAATQKIVTDLTGDLNQVNKRIEDLRTRLSQSTSRVMKAIAVQILIEFGTYLTEDVVNRLKAQFIDPSKMGTINTLVNQVYGIEYIRKNNPNKTDQAIIYGLLKNAEKYSGKTTPLVLYKAQSNLQDCESRSRDFSEAMACTGLMMNSSPWLQMNYEDRAGMAKSAATQAAVSESNTNAGFLSIRECDENTYAKNKANEALRDESSDAVEKSLQVIADLDAANGSAEDKAQAAADYQAAMNKVGSVTENSVDDVLAAVCSGTANTGHFVSGLLTDLVKSNSESARELGKENLPILGKMIKDLAGNYLRGIISGNKPNARTLINDGLQTANTVIPNVLKQSGDLNAIKKETPNNTDGLINFTASAPVDLGNGKQSFTIAWDVRQVAGATSVGVNGPNLNGFDTSGEVKYNSLNGSVIVEVNGTSYYDINVYDANGNSIGYKTVIAQVPVVAGVSTTKVPFMPRGASLELKLR